MNIPLSQPILTYAGEAVQFKDDTKVTRDFLVRDAIIEVLNNLPSDKPRTAQKMARCYAITVKVYGKDEVELPAKDVQFIVECAEESVALTPLSLGRLKEALDLDKKNDEQAE